MTLLILLARFVLSVGHEYGDIRGYLLSARLGAAPHSWACMRLLMSSLFAYVVVFALSSLFAYLPGLTKSPIHRAGYGVTGAEMRNAVL